MLMPLPTRDVPRQAPCSDSRASSRCRDSGATWRALAEPDLAAASHKPRWRDARSGPAAESSPGRSTDRLLALLHFAQALHALDRQQCGTDLQDSESPFRRPGCPAGA